MHFMYLIGELGSSNVSTDTLDPFILVAHGKYELTSWILLIEPTIKNWPWKILKPVKFFQVGIRFLLCLVLIMSYIVSVYPIPEQF